MPSSAFAHAQRLRRLSSPIVWVIRATILAALFVGTTQPGHAQAVLGPPQDTQQGTMEQRVLQLETQIRQLQDNQQTTNQPSQQEQTKPASDAKSEFGAEGLPISLKDGFILKSADGKNSLRLTGQIQADYRGYLNSNDTTDIDTFLLRRARFGLEATLFQYWEFRFLPDFGQGQAVIQDCYMNVHYWDEFQFTAGKFKQPVSYEELVQDRFVPTVERSIIDQLTPQRDVGAMIHGQKLFGDHLDYAVAVSNGEINGNLDTNDQSDFNARVAVRLFNDPAFWEILWGLQVGVSGGFGNENETANPSTLTTSAHVPWFQFNSTVHAEGVRTRLCPELSYFYGGLGLMTEYYRQEQEFRPNTSGPTYRFRTDLPFDGFMLTSTLLLTGEERSEYSIAIDPLRPFDPRHPFNSPGAWELVASVSRLSVGSAAFTPGGAQLADPTKWSRGATEMELGYNWYFNKWVRMQFNWEHAWFDQPVQLGTGLQGRLRSADSLLTRFQIIF
jgi:phosphate-selective porin OprO/OprP